VCLSIPPLGIEGVGLSVLFPSMFCVGMSMGFVDVSMTAQAILLEKDRQMNYMGFCQAAQSFGNFFGVIVGGTMAAFHVSTFLDFLLISVVSVPIILTTFPRLYDFETETRMEAAKGGAGTEAGGRVEGENVQSLENSADTKASREAVLSPEAKIERRQMLIYLTTMGFCAQIGEGTISDWSTLYFRDDLGISSGVLTVSGFAAFSLMMAVGRFLSDYLGMHYGRSLLIKSSGALSFVGLGLAVLAPSIGTDSSVQIVFAVIGFAIAGSGLSICMPIVSSSAGDVPNMASSDAISTVVSMAYFGFLIGPPFFGAMGDLLGAVRWALLLCTAILAVIVVFPGSPPINQRHSNAAKERTELSIEGAETSFCVKAPMAPLSPDVDGHVALAPL
jgi:MFS family permease